VLVIVVEFEHREKKKEIGNRAPIVSEKEEKNCLVSCMSWLGDACLIVIKKQRQMKRREKKTVWWKENDTETQFDDEEEKKWEKKRSEKEQH